MFTGIIEDVGAITKIENRPQSAQIFITCELVQMGVSRGDSIAVDGVCLTVCALTDDTFCADLAPETLKRTTLGSKRIGTKVNLERALKFSDRLGGHIVTGHIDGIAVIKSIVPYSHATQIDFSAPPPILRYLVEKGSIAIDGISLTVNQCTDTGFSVMIVPFTASHTTLAYKKLGDKVNIESDIIGKYVAKFLSQNPASPKTITRDFLDKFNFT